MIFPPWRSTSATVGNGLGTEIKLLVNQSAGAGSTLAKAHYTKAGTNYAEPPCSEAAYVVN
jgi:hypothetical protein